MTELQSAAEQNLDAVIDDILTLVAQESGSYDLPQVRACGEHVLQLITDRLGEPDSVEQSDNDEGGKVYVVTYDGSDQHVAILGHYDTVWRLGSLEELPAKRTTRDGDDILVGPGVVDMKAGLVQGIWAAKLLRESGAEAPTLHFLFNPDEEIGSTSSRGWIERLAQQSDAVLSLEPSAAGKIKTGRKGIGVVHVDVDGVAAHAGLEPEKGASAVHALAGVINQLTALARPELGTTINVGQISGGTATNVVAAQAHCDVDIRVLDPDEPARIDAALAELTSDDDRITITVDTDWNRPPMQLNDATRPLLAVAQEAGRELGRELEDVTVGGASDANFVAPLNVPVLCGMGAVGGGPHARSEHVLVASIPFQTALVATMLERLATPAWKGQPS